MMVENDTSSVEYQLSTSTGPFSIPFYFIENGHIVAELYTQNGDDFNKTTLTIDVDYYLNGAGDKNGGQLTLLSAHSGATLLIYRDPDATQLTSYLATGKFPATSHERALDKLTMLIQKFGWWWDSLALKKPNIFANYYDALNNRIRNLRDPSQAQDAATKGYADNLYQGAISHSDNNFKRTLRVPESEVGMLPGISGRRKKILAFNDTGNPIAVLPESGSAADVMIDLASSDGFKYIGQVRSAAALSLLPGSDGDRVLLESYHEVTGAEITVGGGEFYYVSSLAGVNNGVTIFNGWCRKIINNTLTDYDAGCIKGDTSDVSSRLVNLFSVIKDGMTVKLHCLNYASRNFVIKNVSDIRITGVGGGGIYCWWARDSYNWVFDSDFEAGNDGLSGSLGILSFYNCPGFEVDHVKITGVQLVHPLSNEWGDCGIRYENCPRAKVHTNTLKHFGGWGIFGAFGSDDSVCHHNFVAHVHRQSGINVWANSNNCHADYNITDDTGLYGIEFETFDSHSNPNIFGGKATNNTITRAKIGMCVVGSMKDGLLCDNTVSLCVGAAAAIGVKYASNTRIELARNTFLSFWYGMTVNNCRNVLFADNVADYSQPDYLITDQYQAPVKLVDGDSYSFYCTLPIAAGKIIKIADSVYTVASYSSISAQDLFGSATYYKLSTFYKITLTTEIQDDFYTFANILFGWSTLNTTNGTFGMFTNNSAFSQGSVTDGAEHVRFVGNKVMGVKFGINPNNTFSSLGGEQEFYLNNTLKCESWLRTGLALASRVSISGNVSSMGSSMTAVVTGSDTTYWKPAKTISKDGTAAASTAPTRNYFRVDKTCFVIGYRVILRNWSATEDVNLVLANVNSPFTITAAGSGTEKVVEVKTHLYALSPGTSYPLYLTTATNTMVAGWYSIEALILE
ncbi:hypothetical protein [Klebsiella pneumoniae]|uniref:hypothetical protein n=1 Tax=Klebsiella pneumoniae TaxID=573 RepID=UPI001E482617|nr:hypothetical protein [Klebsiella pneumoniae]MCC4956787.1 hypothetical protein [Klebsiella pneumoniae]